MKVFYRIYPGKPVDRPFANGDKLKLVQGCLRSFLLSCVHSGVQIGHISFMLDGCPAVWKEMIHQAVPPRQDAILHYAITELDGIGNKPSFLKQLEWALNGPDDEFVYFAEDDYLYHPMAIAKMLKLSEMMGSFVSPYDHPDRYSRGDDRFVKSHIEVWDGWHWRTAESTTMTFGAPRHVIRKSADIMREHACEGRAMWYPILGKAQLWSPVPSLATHAQDGVLAPCVDWEGMWKDAV